MAETNSDGQHFHFASIIDPAATGWPRRWARWFGAGAAHVSGSHPAVNGQAIVGRGLELLIDLSERFAFARKKIDELPDLVEWSDLEPSVEAIRFDAARHAATLSATEDRWTDVMHARPGTPQAALRSRIEAERADELAILNGYQRTADRLMNRAADAAAAAAVASELGYDLTPALPSAAAEAARSTLEVVADRLQALTEAWRALDPSAELAAEALAADLRARDEGARRRAVELTERLQQESGVDSAPAPSSAPAPEPAPGADPAPADGENAT